jgi:hypothetical protein
MDVFAIERALRDSELSWSRVQEFYIFYWTGPGLLNNGGGGGGDLFRRWRASPGPASHRVGLGAAISARISRAATSGRKTQIRYRTCSGTTMCGGLVFLERRIKTAPSATP